MIAATHRRRRFLWSALFAGLAVLSAGFALKAQFFAQDAPAPPAAESPRPPGGPVLDEAVTKAHFDSMFARGIAGLRAGDASAAAQAFDAAARLRPEVPAAQVNLGFARLELGQVEAATAAFQTAIALRPAQANAYYGLAEARERQGDLESALGAMKTFLHLAAEEDPFRRRALSAIWEWESALGRHAPAATAGETAPPTQAGTPASQIAAAALIGLDGEPASLAAYAGKTLVLNVWATWCPPCRAELPSLQRLSDTLDPAAFAVVGLSTDTDSVLVREFLRDTQVRYPNYLDPQRNVAAGILGIVSYPQTYVIGADGSVVAQVSGARAWDHPDMIAFIHGGGAGQVPLASN